MLVQNVLLASESYTYQGWEYKNVTQGFSRLYFILDGEAYYEEKGKKVRLKKNHLYLTPVKKLYSLTENSEDKLLHTYVHVTTLPGVSRLTETEVKENTPLADAVALMRKYIHEDPTEVLMPVVQLVLSCIGETRREESAAMRTKEYIDEYDGFSLNMEQLSTALGYSREHLTRSFYTKFYLTPKQYFNLRRMNFGLEKLQQGNSVKSVAEELNYSSAYAFSKAFKKHFGSAPLKYMKILNDGKVP